MPCPSATIAACGFDRSTRKLSLSSFDTSPLIGTAIWPLVALSILAGSVLEYRQAH